FGRLVSSLATSGAGTSRSAGFVVFTTGAGSAAGATGAFGSLFLACGASVAIGIVTIGSICLGSGCLDLGSCFALGAGAVVELAPSCLPWGAGAGSGSGGGGAGCFALFFWV